MDQSGEEMVVTNEDSQDSAESCGLVMRRSGEIDDTFSEDDMVAATSKSVSGPSEIAQSSNSSERTDEEEEVKAAEKLLNSMFYYERYGKEKIMRNASVFRRLPSRHKELLVHNYTRHLSRMKECVEQNEKVLKMLLARGLPLFGKDHSFYTASQIMQTRPATEEEMSKVRSTMKQISRDWSADGKAERDSCYAAVIDSLRRHFPKRNERAAIHILIPGAGLCRLCWELVSDGFSVHGNEFSLSMLLVANVILNACEKVNEFIFYPYVLETCNNWTYDDIVRPVMFPDVCPATHVLNRKNTFSMTAGEFVQTFGGSENNWSVILTVFFIDTARNVLDYVDTIHRILKKGGLWINFGPLTYHYADSNEDSIELPYAEIIRVIKTKGFRFLRDDRREKVPPALYACNSMSMLTYQYNCGFFECVKL
ncbi:hypothetical protein AB6A40_000965 [Gnathostoma spinigerum]|uniref:carnosine N-methyltransferase n=1 Tax=Gnathostoma spinigerum TaxID=75299 RepID=A0ABD6E4E0_9BILA